DKQPAPISLDVGVKASQPKLDLKVKSKGTLTFDLAGKTYRFKDLNVDLGGTASTITLSKADLTASNILLDSAPERVLTEGLKVQAKGKLAADDLDFSLSAPRLDISPDKASSEPAEVNVALNGPERKVKAIVKVSAIEGSRKALNIRSTQIDVDLAQKDTSVKGTVTTPMTVNLDEKIFDLPKIQAEFTLSLPKAPQKTAKLSLSGATRADVGKEGVSGNMIAKIDESTLKANFGVSRFSEPAIRFDVDVDKINVDRYLPPKKDEKGGEAPAAKTPAAKTPEKAAEEPIDFSPLKTLDVDGKLRVGALQARNIKVGNLRSDIRAKGGRLAVDPLSADLYEGSTKGDISIDANANRIGVKQNLTGVSIGPLLRDAANKDILEGKGSVSLDVSATGSLVSAMKRTLNGNARIALRNGAVKGIDLAGTVRQVKAALGQKDAEGTASKVEKTDFTEMNASFVIKNGVAHNEDLSLKSPFLRVTGDGNINIGEDSLDYVVSVAFVETMAGQGGKDLTDLRGLAVPVRLSGPYAALKYRVEFSRMFSSKEQIEAGKELLRNKLGDIGKGLLGGGKEQGQGGEKEKAPPRKPEDALKDALKGLIR
ncbi:MAG TPA: AsmA family protein, partial [Thermodesulfobacteriota bacterium]|nr:AsmA family protein [Thermodesulfobacteriota bacterium]